MHEKITGVGILALALFSFSHNLGVHGSTSALAGSAMCVGAKNC